jgi:hypothetical protein
MNAEGFAEINLSDLYRGSSMPTKLRAFLRVLSVPAFR